MGQNLPPPLGLFSVKAQNWLRTGDIKLRCVHFNFWVEKAVELGFDAKNLCCFVCFRWKSILTKMLPWQQGKAQPLSVNFKNVANSFF